MASAGLLNYWNCKHWNCRNGSSETKWLDEGITFLHQTENVFLAPTSFSPSTSIPASNIFIVLHFHSHPTASSIFYIRFNLLLCMKLDCVCDKRYYVDYACYEHSGVDWQCYCSIVTRTPLLLSLYFCDILIPSQSYCWILYQRTALFRLLYVNASFHFTGNGKTELRAVLWKSVCYITA